MNWDDVASQIPNTNARQCKEEYNCITNHANSSVSLTKEEKEQISLLYGNGVRNWETISKIVTNGRVCAESLKNFCMTKLRSNAVLIDLVTRGLPTKNIADIMAVPEKIVQKHFEEIIDFQNTILASLSKDKAPLPSIDELLCSVEQQPLIPHSSFPTTQIPQPQQPQMPMPPKIRYKSLQGANASIETQNRNQGLNK